MAERGVRINLWTNPYVSPESDIYKEMYPLSGSHTVWCGIVPDFADARARALFSSKFDKEHVSIGVSGYKIDEIDGYDRYVWPDVATFPSGVPAEQMRQTYGLWVQRITAELYRKNNQRTYGLVRGSNGGGSSFPYVIYNDYYSHQDFITALINSGFCGVLWTPEAPVPVGRVLAYGHDQRLEQRYQALVVPRRDGQHSRVRLVAHADDALLVHGVCPLSF